MESIIVNTGLSAIVVGVVEVAKRVGLPNNLAYPLALLLGVFIAFVGIPGISWGEVIINGLAIGLVSSGLYEGGKKLPVVSTLLTRGK